MLEKLKTPDDPMKKPLLTLILSLSCTSVWAQIHDSANGHYYDVIQAPEITWADARAAALNKYFNGLEGHLATITSSDELGFVDQAIQNSSGGEMWVGGYQNPTTETDPQAGWTWVNGEGSFPGVNSVTPFAQWNSGEPNDYYGPGSEQWLGTNLGSGDFNDEGNLLEITGYVIEYDTHTIRDVPDASATALLLGGALALLGIFGRRARK
jgi:hypothetical protein